MIFPTFHSIKFLEYYGYILKHIYTAKIVKFLCLSTSFKITSSSSDQKVYKIWLFVNGRRLKHYYWDSLGI